MSGSRRRIEMVTTSWTLAVAWQALIVNSYRERLHVPWSWWLRGIVVVLIVWWIFLVSTNTVISLVAALVTAAFVVALLSAYGSVEIKVTAEWIMAGKASIDRVFCGRAQIVDAAAFRDRMGPSANARAFTLTRPYVGQGVLVEIDDPRDSTPYWLLSSRNPHRLVAALQTTSGDRDG